MGEGFPAILGRMIGAREATAGDRFTRSVVVGALGIGRTVALAVSLVLVWAGPALLWAGAATVTATLVLLAANRRVGSWLYGSLDAAVALGAVLVLPDSRPVLILAIGAAALVGATLGLRAAVLWVPLAVLHGFMPVLLIGVPVAGLASALLVPHLLLGKAKHAPSLLRVRVIAVVAAAVVVGTAGAALGAHPSPDSPINAEVAAPRFDGGVPDAPGSSAPGRAVAGVTSSHSASPASLSASPKSSASPSVSPLVPIAPLGPSAMPSPTKSADSDLACEVKYQNSSEWNVGFVANVTITNTGSTPITGWTLVYSYAAGQKLNGSWNATVGQSGATVTATNSTKIAPQGAATFGVQGTWQGSDPAPRSFTLNGTTCGTVT